MFQNFRVARFKSMLLIGGAMIVPAAAMAQDTGDEALVDDALAQDNVIVVSGFRESLNAAIDAKRDAVGQVDVIVAEDIAKFPDTNLAESLQRVPGVAIERDAGEGRQITVRGLGSQFTRVRVNGMETIATSVDGQSSNRDRAFDFNVFASELFNSIVVHKTASASLDEGSLGAVIDLNTGNPLAYGAGTKVVATVQGRYNDLNDDLAPRIAGLFAWNNDDETLGISASAAWSKYETAELGHNTVRWTNGAITQRADSTYGFTNVFRSVDGVNCRANPTDANCVAVAEAFHPRIPRYGLVNHERERLGATAAIQFRPSDSTDIEIDALYSNFKENRDEFWGEVLIRSGEKDIDVTDYTIDADNNLISADLANAFIRTERYRRESQTEFYQISGRVEQRLGDNLTAKLLGGFSKSDAGIPVETSLMFDDRDGSYSYDYTDMTSPVLAFGTDVTDPTNFQLAEFRDRPSSVDNKFRTVALDLAWTPVDGLVLSGGPFYRRFDFFTTMAQRDSTYCAAFTCTGDQYGAPVDAELAEQFTLGNAGQPAGNTNGWVVPNLDAVTDFLDLYDREAVVSLGNERGVTETVTGAYFQSDFDIDNGTRVSGNFGLRYARTKQESFGYVGTTFVEAERTYEDFLPSANINVFPTDNIILRGAIAQVVTRPSLGSVTPGGSVDEFNFRISRGNPYLTPYRAWNYDVSVEWYFARGALLSLAGFVKDISSFPTSVSNQITFAESGLPTSILTPGRPAYEAVVDGVNPGREFEERTSTDGEGATIRGLELGLNLPFSAFSGGFLSNFGVLGNVTYVDSAADYEFGGEEYTVSFAGVSKYSANGTVYYDDGRFSVRVSGAYRSDYNTGTSGNGNFLEGFNSTFNLDASIRYQLTDRVELLIDGNNLTDEYRYRWTDRDARRVYEHNHFGRVIMVGARVEM